jgi:prolipoprotein diacylglyceryltransferase
MACSVTCSIAAVFIIGKIYFYNATTNSNIVKHYKDKLPTDLKQLYDKLSNERLNISIFGYVLGFILSLFIIFYNLKLKLKSEKLSNISLVCIVVSTCFLTNYFYYMLTPKSDWMLNHINNPEQTKLWLQLYRNMSVYYHSGLVLGIIAVGIFAFAFRC